MTFHFSLFLSPLSSSNTHITQRNTSKQKAQSQHSIQNVREPGQGRWEVQQTSLTSHFRVRVFPFPVLQGIGESTVSPLLSLDWKCNFWLGDKFHWNKANKQHAPWIHYNGIFNSIGMMCTFKEKDILENGEPSKSYRFRKIHCFCLSEERRHVPGGEKTQSHQFTRSPVQGCRPHPRYSWRGWECCNESDRNGPCSCGMHLLAEGRQIINKREEAKKM